MNKCVRERLNRIAFPSILIGLIFCSMAGVATQRAHANDDEGSLRSAMLVFRHGVISPKYNLPNLNFEWPMGFRQLTAIGIRDIYEKGQSLRKTYIDSLKLVGGSFKASEVFVRSSNTDRALQTAQTLALGLFPLGTGPDPAEYDPSLEAAPSKSLAFSPVPVHSVALENDAVLRPWTGKANCVRYRNYITGLPATDLYREQAGRYLDFLNRIAEITGFNDGAAPTKILYEINEIYEPLSAMVQHGMLLPPEISHDDMQLLSDLSDWNYHHQFLGKGIGRLTGGPFIGELILNFNDVRIDGPRARSLYLYSGHQRTLLGIEAALGIEEVRTSGPLFRGRVPPLSSFYAFELHKVGDGEFGVRLRFVDGEIGRTIEIPDCGQELCPFDRFVDLMAKVVPADWRRECGS